MAEDWIGLIWHQPVCWSFGTRNCVFEYKIDSIQILFLCISLAHSSFIISAATAAHCVISSWAVSACASGNGYSPHTGLTEHIIAVSLLTTYISWDSFKLKIELVAQIDA